MTLSRRWRRSEVVSLVLLVAYGLILYGATALLQRGLFERDGYFHARYAQLIPARGLSRDFPWTEVSTWQHQFCDKEFLFHVALMPFTLLTADPIFGARVFSVLLSTAVLLALFLVARTNRVPWPAFFAALPLASGGLFIARLGMIRSHVLSMLLLTIGVHFLLRRNWRAVAVLGFVYAWSYTMPFVLLMTAAPFAIGQWIGRGAFDWRSVVAAAAGATLGLIVHPYSPITLETFLTYLQVFQMGIEGAGKSGFELGNEIYPYAPRVFFDIYPLLVILVPALVLYVAFRWRRLAPATLGTVLSALCWFGLTTAAPRFAEYSVLLLAIGCGLVVRDTAEHERMVLAKFWSRLPMATGLLAIVALVGFHGRSMTFYESYEGVSAPPRFFKGASAWMAQHLAPEETVINLFWDDFPELFYDGFRQRYLWGLDPTYSIRADRAKATMLEGFRAHRVPIDGTALATLFHSRTLVLRLKRAARFPELRKPPFREAYRDESAVVFTIDQ